MIVDMHCHIAPPKWAETKPFPRSLIKIEEFFQQKAQAGVSLSVISNPMMNIPGSKQNDLELDLIREYEDFALDIIAKHPGKVMAFLGVNPFGETEMLYEIERAVTTLGFKGVMVNSSVEGKYLDAPHVREFWDLVGNLGIPVFVHPPAMPIGSQNVVDYRLVENTARWNDITLGLAAIIFAGILEKYPKLKLISAMGGGGLAALKGRLDVGYKHKELIPKHVPQPEDFLSAPPSAAFKQIYVDSCTYSAEALALNIAAFGADHILFGSDVPPSPTPTSTSIQFIRNLDLDEQTKENIFWRNATALLHLEETILA